MKTTLSGRSSFLALGLFLAFLWCAIPQAWATWATYGGSYNGSYTPTSTTPPTGQSTWSKSGTLTITANSPTSGLATFSQTVNGSYSYIYKTLTSEPTLPANDEYSFYARLMFPTTASLNTQKSASVPVVSYGFRDEGASSGKTVMLGWFKETTSGLPALALTNSNGKLGTGSVTLNTTNYFDGQFHEYYLRKSLNSAGTMVVQVFVDGVQQGSTINYSSLGASSGTGNGFGVFTWGGKSNLQVDETQFGTSTPELALVDTTTQVNAFNKDSQLAMQDFFSGASLQGPITTACINTYLTPIGVHSSRGINIDYGTDYSNGVFTPSSTLASMTSFYSQNAWNPHIITALAGPPSFPTNTSSWTSQNWSDYQAYAEAYIRYVVDTTSAGQLAFDDFDDGDFTNNPTWQVISQAESAPINVTSGHLNLPGSNNGATATIALPFTSAPAGQPLYVSFDTYYPYAAPSDYEPLLFSVVNTTSNTGYTIWGNPNVLTYGSGTATSGFAWSAYESGDLTAGESNEALGLYSWNSQTQQQSWEHISMCFDPTTSTITVTRNGNLAVVITNAEGLSGLNQFQLLNYASVAPWSIDNVYVGTKPQDPGGDNFNSGALSSAWTVLSADPDHPWQVSNGTLIMPTGVSSVEPRVSLALNSVTTSQPFNVSVDVKYPQAPSDYQPVVFSLVQKGTNGSPDMAYNIWADPNATAYAGDSGFGYCSVSNFNSSTYDSGPTQGGVSGEALGNTSYYNGTSHWETLNIQVTASTVTVTRNGTVVMTFPNSLGLTRVDEFQIANENQYIAWQIDNVYSWYGTNARPDILFEVGNEPDGQTGANSWFIPSSVTTNATQADFNYYFPVYQAWANALSTFSQTHARPTFVAGPAATAFSYVGAPFNWLSGMVSACDSTGTRLDMLTFHYYGNDGPVSGKEGWSSTSLSTMLDDMNGYLTSSQTLQDTRIGMTEWGPTYIIDGNLADQGAINGDNIGAGWMANFLLNVADLPLDKGDLLTDLDFDDASGNDNYTWASFLTSDGSTPKSLYNVAKMFTMMPGNRTNVTLQPGQGMGIYSTKDASGNLGVLIYNYDYDFNTSTNTSLPHFAETKMSGVTANMTYTVVPYLIDATHANAAQYWEANPPQTIQQAGSVLTAGTSFQVTANASGVVTLPTSSLTAGSVTLWLLTPN